MCFAFNLIAHSSVSEYWWGCSIDAEWKIGVVQSTNFAAWKPNKIRVSVSHISFLFSKFYTLTR